MGFEEPSFVTFAGGAVSGSTSDSDSDEEDDDEEDEDDTSERKRC